MKKIKFILSAVICLLVALHSFAQALWTESDRKYLIDNLKRTRDLVIEETKNLTEQQWTFKEAPDRWSINEVVEHLAIWELLLDREISQALVAGPQPELAKRNEKTDSSILAFLTEEKPHITTEYTKPFTFTVPMGLNRGANNLAWLVKMRNESLNFLDSTKTDLRYYFLRAGRGNVHQVYITIFAHTDRHLRQLRKIKSNANYPRG
jgi:DinB family protein